MFDHIDFAVGDLARSLAFYTAALAPLGIAPVNSGRTDGREGMGFGAGGVPRFWVAEGEPVTGRLHVAFTASSRSQVDAFHLAALAAGGTDRGAPGLRPRYGAPYYAAFVMDPDGHVVEAVCRD
jgi:catechol 2,3-dioxygenase-like lactoylglutathione lyase family enzyme